MDAQLIRLKFHDPDVTADGKPRARVELAALRTLWFNTGTRCNITCQNCYIESSPYNDRLVYISAADVERYLDEIHALALPTTEIGLTGGEPFLNPHIIDIIRSSLQRGFDVLVLTNALRPMRRWRRQLLELRSQHGAALTLRVSLDHYDCALHETERGPGTYAPTLAGIKWLSDNGFRVHIAGRRRWGDEEAGQRAGYAALFRAEAIAINADDPTALVLFPEMDATAEVPEITSECWGILRKDPGDVMCASSRMVVKRKDGHSATVVSCTLLPYDRQFDFGPHLADALRPVKLNHPHCAKFCVFGGGKCSA
jgi:uncharacterized Fe-S cluster-containing radical SAM superfamily protein